MYLALPGNLVELSSEAQLSDLLLRDPHDPMVLKKSFEVLPSEMTLYITKSSPFAVIQACLGDTEVCATTRMEHDPGEIYLIETDDLEVPRAMCLSIEEMVDLVPHYYRTGPLDPRGNWRKYPEIEQDRQAHLRRQEPGT